MEELTLITEEREYTPEYSNPETIAGSNPSEDNVEVYTSEIIPPEVARDTGLHRDPQVEFRYTTYYLGPDLGYFKRDLQMLLRERTGNPNLVLDAYYIRHSNPGEPTGSNFHSLMLHAVAEMYGPGGIVVDEAKARATSCECVEYKPAKYIAVDNAFNRANYPEEIGKVYDSPPSYVAVEKVEGKYWCTSKGIVGALTDEQEKVYCNPRVMVEKPGMKERMVKWAEAVEICRAQLPPTDGRTRLEIYLDCMSKELKKAGVEA